jgi:hypothetical protein
MYQGVTVPAYGNPPPTVCPASDNSQLAGNNFMTSVCTDISIHIGQSLKEKIWKGEYVEFGSLLDKQETEPQIIKLINGQLHVTQTTKKQDILSIEKWTDAFMIYMSIILIKNPFLARDLLQYCNTIRSASKLNPAGWGKYDRLFRYKLAQYSSTKWSSVDAELWLITMTNNHSLDLQYSKPCFDFNNKGYCTKYGCKYLHKCKICLGPHSFIICRSGHTSNISGNLPRFTYNPPRFPRPPQHPTAFNIQVRDLGQFI